jgi:uncharacterized repeat protein (TIGR03803 family)
MENSRLFSAIVMASTALAAVLFLMPGISNAGTEKSFSLQGGEGGSGPYAGLVLDSAGNLYGTTAEGGFEINRCHFIGGCGVVFALGLDQDGHVAEKVLHQFSGHKDGAHSNAGVIFDSAGNLYGTTLFGNAGKCYGGCGVVYELTPSAGGQWTETTLDSFTGGADGGQPWGGLVFDSSGNLYGTAYYGGLSRNGVVFELTPSGSGEWSETVLHSFSGGADGGLPKGALAFDTAGNLYGTTVTGGTGDCSSGCGVAYELSPGVGGQWTETILHNFCTYSNCSDGSLPEGGVALDSLGNLYGTTEAGGSGFSGVGTVFSLQPLGSGQWSFVVVYAFTGGDDGGSPDGSLTVDKAGNIYGTTLRGGSAACSGGCGVFSA